MRVRERETKGRRRGDEIRAKIFAVPNEESTPQREGSRASGPKITSLPPSSTAFKLLTIHEFHVRAFIHAHACTRVRVLATARN